MHDVTGVGFQWESERGGGRPSTGETDPSPLPHDSTGTSGSGVCIKVLRSDTTTDLNILNI